MKFLQAFAAIMLMSVANIADSGDIGIINLWQGEEVNAKNFTIVTKAFNFEAGQNLLIEIKITNPDTGAESIRSVRVVTK